MRGRPRGVGLEADDLLCPGDEGQRRIVAGVAAEIEQPPWRAGLNEVRDEPSLGQLFLGGIRVRGRVGCPSGDARKTGLEGRDPLSQSMEKSKQRRLRQRSGSQRVQPSEAAARCNLA